MGFIDKLRQYDNLWAGLVIGLVIPVVLYFVIQPLKAGNFDFMIENYRKTVVIMLPMLLSRCVFPNAILFFMFIWGRFDKTARGILYSTAGLTLALIMIRIAYLFV